MTNTTFPDGTTQLTAYDADGRKTSHTDQAGVTTAFGYDGLGRLTSVTNALQKVTTYAYDEAGNQTNQVDALLRTNVYVYDGLGRRLQHLLPGGQSEGFGYDLAGNLLAHTNFNGLVITNAYDPMNRLTNTGSTNGYSVTFAYSQTGQRTNMVDASGTSAYAYDLRDRLKAKAVAWNAGPAITLNYAYDFNGNLTNLWSTTSGGVTNAYQYDALNRLTNVLASGSAVAGYAFDGVGNLQAMNYANGVTNLYQYDQLNRLTNLTWKLTTTTLGTFSYQLGLTGNRTNLIETVGTSPAVSRTNRWQYDTLYRMTNEVIVAPTNGTLGYVYDPVGNRTNRTITGLSLTNQNFAFTTNDWLSTDSYDSNGNTTASAGQTYGYDAMDRIVAVTNGSTIIAIGYDGDGNRVSKTISGMTEFYLVDDRNPTGYAQVQEEWVVGGGTTNLSRVYAYGLDLINQRVIDGATSYYGFDGNGSTRFLTSTSGVITDTYAYDAYGNLIASTGSTANNYRYSGEQFDSDLGFYYLRARYLNPNTGRFWTMDTDEGDSEDPISLHRYLYCEANPVDGSDPSGHEDMIELMDVVLTGEDMDAARAVIAEVAKEQAMKSLLQTVVTIGATAVALATLEGDDHEIPTMYYSQTEFPIIAPKIAVLQTAHPQWMLLHYIGPGPFSGIQRKFALNKVAGKSPGAGNSWDEYPFATTLEGGTPAVFSRHLKGNNGSKEESTTPFTFRTIWFLVIRST
jgi:RHS repeat-associated protein